MPVLYDDQNDYTRSVLDRAQNRGEITLAELEAIIKAGKGGLITPNENDIADTIDVLAAMGVEIELISRIRRRARTPLEIIPGVLTAAAVRKIPSKRTWIQNLFARLAPQTPPPLAYWDLARHNVCGGLALLFVGASLHILWRLGSILWQSPWPQTLWQAGWP